MKKTFNISHPKIKTARLFEGVKHELKKYIRRERNKKLPADADYWDFDCKYGNTEAEAVSVHLSQINKMVDGAEKEGLTSFYVEIIARAAERKNIDNNPFDINDDIELDSD